MIFNPEIFRAYDIRGIYGKDFDDEFALAFGKAVVEYFKANRILIGHDSRESSLILSEKISESLVEYGCDVVNIGLATTPFFNFSLSSLKPDAGIMVTASHNAKEFGGFKIYSKAGAIIGLSAGLSEIKRLIEAGNFKPKEKKGEFLKAPVAKLMDKYVEGIISKSKVNKGELSNLKFKITGRKSVMCEVGSIIDKLGLKLTDSGYDIAFSFDEDSDRLIVSDANNNKISTDFIVGILTKNAVRFLSKPKIVYDVHFSKGVIGKFNEWGIKSYISKVGRFYLRDSMIKHRANIGGEISGHIYFKENNENELPLLAMLRLLKILEASKMSISDMIKPFQTWQSSGRLDFPVKDLETAKNLVVEVEKKFNDGEISKLDGITIEYCNPEKLPDLKPDEYWWFNLRASNTESLVRLLIEAKRKDVLDQKISQILEIIKAAQ
jgi:phosphomannomutase